MIDADQAKSTSTFGCAVKDVVSKVGTLEFTRLDKGLPFNYGIFYALNFRYVPVPEELNRYLLTIKNLAKGTYEITADGRSIGQFTAEQLGAGVNIASTTADPWQPGGPWNAQANELKSLTDARHEVVSANRQLRTYLPNSPACEQLEKQAGDFDNRIVEMQRTVARPQSYRFIVMRYEAPPKKGRK